MEEHMNYTFPTSYPEILNRIISIQPSDYARSRNFIDGAVTQLSPYISRGTISTKMVYKHLLERDVAFSTIEKLVQELAWRDYWQQVWIAKGDEINQDLRHPQSDVANQEITAAVVEAKTGIKAIDTAIKAFYETGYLHNHNRMYIAAICCNMAKNHWHHPARWMYYHLLDGDWASNALSWQWVAGSNSNKKYVANQENINKYCHTKQSGTFLDIPYDAFSDFEIPSGLKSNTQLSLSTDLPASDVLVISEEKPTYLFTYYNLDPKWAPTDSNSILILEPSHFKKYPVGKKALNFAMCLSKNIEGLQCYVGEFDDLKKSYLKTVFHFKEHPTNNHFKGIAHDRAWMFDVKGYYRSFFAFWKKCKKEIRNKTAYTQV
jgi:deoxyribodipyrimidine photo-lyase